MQRRELGSEVGVGGAHFNIIMEVLNHKQLHNVWCHLPPKEEAHRDFISAEEDGDKVPAPGL